MANQLADLKTNASATPPVRSKVNRLNGRVRWFEATITLPVAVNIGETITWGDLPVGARIIGHLSQLNFSAGAAGSLLALGDSANGAAKHLAPTAINAAGTAVPQAQSANGAQFETSDASNNATNNCTLISTVSGAAAPIGQVITLKMAYVTD